MGRRSNKFDSSGGCFMIETIFFDLDGTLVKSNEATARLFQDITKFFSINISGEDFRAIFREQALSEMRLLSQYNYIEKLNIGSYDLFYLNLEHSPLKQLEIEQYRTKVCKNTISKLDYYNVNLTENSLMLYLKENWIKFYDVFDNVYNVLKKLSTMYKLVIVTNGFDEIQRLKVDFCNIKQYFKDIIVSSQFGIGKPHKEFYSYVIERTKSIPEKSVMVGDSIKNDIIGAKNVGMNTIFIQRNPNDNLKYNGYINNVHSIVRIEEIIGVINK